MSVTYSQTVIDARLQAVADTIDGGGSNGSMVLRADSTVISMVSLARPCGTVNSGILTFVGTLLDPAATATGYVNNVQIWDSNGNIMVSDLTVNIPSHTADVIIFNGLNSTLITAGQAVQILAAQITGS